MMSIEEKTDDFERGLRVIESMTQKDRKTGRLSMFCAPYMGPVFFRGDETPAEIYEEIKREAWFCDRNYKETSGIIEAGEFVFE